MTVWVVRAGRDGQREEFALDNNMVLIGWDELSDYKFDYTRHDKDSPFR